MASSTSAAHEDALARVSRVVEADLVVDLPSPDTDLLEEGHIDSLGLVTLLVSLEDEFGVRIPVDGFSPEAFRSVRMIVAFLDGIGALPAPT